MTFVAGFDPWMLKLVVAPDCGVVAGQLLGPDGLPGVLVGGLRDPYPAALTG